MMRKALLLIALIVTSSWATAAPTGFEQAKAQMRQYVYHDQTEAGTFYCGCNWRWVGRSGGRVDLASCGYEIRAQQVRAERIEWEHIVPASNFGRARQCWQNGGRRNCTQSDPVFSAMEADMHNLTPSIGEINADRSNYNFGPVSGVSANYGSCDFKVDTRNRIAEPSENARGRIARTYFYMHDRYNLPMSRQQQQLFMAWHRQHPVTNLERELDARIAQQMGHHNEFVTGQRHWTLGHKNTADGVVSPLPQTQAAPNDSGSTAVRANRRSGIYHLPHCSSYNRMSEANVVEYENETAAKNAGFRRAGNCR